MPVGVSLLEALLVAVHDTESVMLLDRDCDADADVDAEFDAEGVCDADTVPLGVREGLNGEVDGDPASCEVAEAEADAETDAAADVDGDVVLVADMLLDCVWEGDGERLADCDELPDSDALLVPVPERDDVTERPMVGNVDGDCGDSNDVLGTDDAEGDGYGELDAISPHSVAGTTYGLIGLQQPPEATVFVVVPSAHTKGPIDAMALYAGYWPKEPPSRDHA